VKHHFTNQDIQIQTYVLLAKNTLNQLKRMKKYRPLPSYLEVKKSKIEGLAWILYTLKEIKSGEELTVKYELYEVNK
jgi:hypothetical protein